MLIVKLIRFFLGYVVFTGAGGFPERFINLCVKYRIPLWDLKNHGESFEGKTTIRGYKRIRPAAFRSGVKLQIREKRGLPFLTAQNKKRMGLLIGFAVCAALIGILSMHIWTVEVSGNVKIPTETVLEAAERLGVTVGARRKSLDAKALADELLYEIDGLSFAAVNIDACKAVIEVRESIAQPAILDTETPSNIIADEAGILTKIEVYSGTAALPVGSAVLKDDLLISGVVQNLDNSETLKGAQGNVYAQVERNMDFSCENLAFFSCSAVNERYILEFFGLHIPLGRSMDTESYAVSRYLSDGKTQLPVGITRERREIFDTETTLAAPADRARFTAKQFAAAYKAVWNESVILAEQVTFDFENTEPFIHGTVTCEKEIGINREIFVEKISD